MERSIERLLAPYLAELLKPQPLVYTANQAAAVLEVSADTVGRLVKRGLLPRVPHVDGKLLIPRVAVERFVNDASSSEPDDGEASADVSPLHPAGRRRASGP